MLPTGQAPPPIAFHGNDPVSRIHGDGGTGTAWPLRPRLHVPLLWARAGTALVLLHHAIK